MSVFIWLSWRGDSIVEAIMRERDKVCVVEAVKRVLIVFWSLDATC